MPSAQTGGGIGVDVSFERVAVDVGMIVAVALGIGVGDETGVRRKIRVSSAVSVDTLGRDMGVAEGERVGV